MERLQNIDLRVQEILKAISEETPPVKLVKAGYLSAVLDSIIGNKQKPV